MTGIEDTRRRDPPLSQASEPRCGCPSLVPPYNSRQDRGQPKSGERAHEQVAVLIVVLKSVKDTEAHKTHRGQKAHEQGYEARGLPPLGVVGQSVEVGRVAHMVDSEDRPGEGDAGHGTSHNKHGLKVEGCNITDEWNHRVDLAGVSGLTDCEPSEEEDCEGGKPGNACYEGEYPKLVRIADVGSKNPWPKSSCHACESLSLSFKRLWNIIEFRAQRLRFF